VWISILLDENNIYYINLRHKWPQVDYHVAQKFVSKLLNSEIRLIAHNFKYDLQILEHFIVSSQEEITKSSQEDFWQMQLGL
jgi:hypothetical protein